jgi:hypothetical protein
MFSTPLTPRRRNASFLPEEQGYPEAEVVMNHF